LDPDPATLLTEPFRGGRLDDRALALRPDVSEAERTRIEPFLHNTDTRIGEARAPRSTHGDLASRWP
jgi:hypothetical protein